MRLIDADKLIEDMNKELSTCEDYGIMPTWWTANTMIKNQLPAYDIDKVVAELETAREDYFNDYQSSVVYGLTLAIEIIMKGYIENERL